MEKEQSSKIEENINDKSVTSEQSKDDEKSKEEKVELTPEDKIKELEEKLTRTLAEMENQRRRFEKENYKTNQGNNSSSSIRPHGLHG